MCRGPLITSKPMSISSALLLEQPKKDTAPQRSNRSKCFWAKNVAKRTVTYVEQEVDKLMGSCQFLQETDPSLDIAPLWRNEIELGDLVGCGGFSDVYQVRSLDLCHEDYEDEVDFEQEHARRKLSNCKPSGFVVKHLRKELMTERTKLYHAAANLVMEAEFLARLDHPHILKIRGWAAEGVASFGDAESSGYFLLLDRLDCTLSQRIQEWNKRPNMLAPMDTKLKYATQIAQALAYMHDHNIIYRDLKPDNVGILDDSIQLFDLGTCRELPESGTDDEEFHMSGVGTRRYMAPEVAMGKGYNRKADVYSYAMVVYEMFTHIKPFDLYNPSMHQLLVCEQGQRPDLPASLPTELQDLLRKAWDPVPSQRPTINAISKDIFAMTNKPTGTMGTLQSIFSVLHPARVLLRKLSSGGTDMDKTATSTVANTSFLE